MYQPSDLSSPAPVPLPVPHGARKAGLGTCCAPSGKVVAALKPQQQSEHAEHPKLN